MFYNIQGKENISETVKTENKNKLHNQGIIMPAWSFQYQ